MRRENVTERKTTLLKFGLLYAGSFAALIAVFWILNGGRPAKMQPSASAAGTLSPAGSLSSVQRTADSLREELALARNQLSAKDSLIGILQSRPQPRIDSLARPKPAIGDPADRQALEKSQHQIAADQQALEQLESEKEAIGLQLGEMQKNRDALSDQLANLRHTNEFLQTRLNEMTHGAASADHGAGTDHTAASPNPNANAAETRNATLATKNAALEKRSGELADQLRFAEADCNISRADARQIVYNARQRKDLLTDALTILNELAKSQDPDVRKKAKDRLSVLRSVAEMVHD